MRRIAVPSLLVCACALASARAASASSTLPSRPSEGTLTVRDGRQLVDVPLGHTDVRIRVSGFLADVEVEPDVRQPLRQEDRGRLPVPAADRRRRRRHGDGHRQAHDPRRHRAPRRGEAQVRGGARRRPRRGAADAGAPQPVHAGRRQPRARRERHRAAALRPARSTTRRAATSWRSRWSPARATCPRAKAAPATAAAQPRAEEPAIAPAVLPAGFRSSHDISLDARIDAGVPIAGVRSPSHDIVVDGRPHVTLAAGDRDPEQGLHPALPGRRRSPRARGAGAPRAGRGDGLVLPARAAARHRRRPPTSRRARWCSCVDTSSSMAGEPLAKARDVVRRALGALAPDDTFQIIRFDDRAGALGPLPIANRPRNVDDRARAGSTGSRPAAAPT